MKKNNQGRPFGRSALIVHEKWLKQEGLVFELDGFCGACVRAGAATDARVFVDDGLVVNDFDGFNGATFCTGAATEAFLFIHNSCHFSFLLLEILSPGADARRLHTQPGAFTKYIFFVVKFKLKYEFAPSFWHSVVIRYVVSLWRLLTSKTAEMT